jgi:beta-galactosidase
LENGNSFAMYMAHGGTNFGLTAGANGLNLKVNDYWGAITSYDYDAPIN